MIGSPRILIVRLSALGDAAMASPLIGAIRRRHPDAYIGWLAQPEVAPVLRAHPELDELILWPRKRLEDLAKRGRFIQLQREWRSFFRELRDRRFDWALDPQGLFRSGVLAFLSGAKRRVGVASAEGSRWLMSEVIDPGDDPTRISSEYQRLAEYLDLPVDDGFPMHVAIAADDQQWAAEAVPDSGLEEGFVALLPFTTRPQKHWFEPRWAALARLLGDRGEACVILGGPGDAEAGERIRLEAEREMPPGHGVPGARAAVHNWAGETTLGQAIATLDRATAVVGVDTGLTHIALARQRPTVCLFGATLPYLDTGPHPGRVLYRKQPCSPCHRRPICGGVHHCMRQILHAEVARALGEIRAGAVAGSTAV